MKTITATLATIVATLLLGSNVFGEGFPTVSVDSIARKYGTPDSITSTEYDKPRPPFVTKFVTYTSENVRFVLIADAPMGSPPPYTTWKLMGVQDPRNNDVLSAAEVARRMARRSRN
jgi:hypothetical protein